MKIIFFFFFFKYRFSFFHPYKWKLYNSFELNWQFLNEDDYLNCWIHQS
jgi:hypothetical protein